jgi:hypothetical protein
VGKKTLQLIVGLSATVEKSFITLMAALKIPRLASTDHEGKLSCIDMCVSGHKTHANSTITLSALASLGFFVQQPED